MKYFGTSFFLSFVSTFLRKLKKYLLTTICSNAVAHKFSLNLGVILKFYAPKG